MPSEPTRNLELVPNPKPSRDYLIQLEIPEFTCVCPRTGQPDFATIRIDYVPDQVIIELKSIKLYMWSYATSARSTKPSPTRFSTISSRRPNRGG